MSEQPGLLPESPAAGRAPNIRQRLARAPPGKDGDGEPLPAAHPTVVTPGYRLTLLRQDAELRALEPEWRELYALLPLRNPFWSYDWIRACRACLAPRATPYVITARRGDRLVGVAPLRLERQWHLRVLRFIGDGRSDYQGFLLHPEEPGVEQALLGELARRSAEWDLTVLRQLAEEYSGLASLPLPPPLRGRRTHGTVSPYLRLPQDWGELLRKGPASVRRAARAERRFRREGGTVERIADKGMARQLEVLACVERRSWKVRGGRPRFQSGPGANLIRRTLSGLGPRGELEVWLAHMAGRPVAFLLNFVTPERVWFYQGAFDEAYRRYFPGGVLHYCCVRRLWSDGLREYDLLSGDEPYKYGWANATRALHHRALFPARPRGYLAFALLVGVRWQLRRSARLRAAHGALCRLLPRFVRPR
jgi:CelD/BcsL family acetyltransferase involved in cellulose biosynthesis